MTFEQARREGLDVFTFRTREQRAAFAATQVVRTVEFEESTLGGLTFTLICLAVAPRIHTTTQGAKAFNRTCACGGGVDLWGHKEGCALHE